MKKLISLIVLLFVCSFSNSQNIINEINTESYNNYANTYWDGILGTNSFTNHTNDYALNINFYKLNINNLAIVDNGNTAADGFSELNSDTFTDNYEGEIGYAIIQDGAVSYGKSDKPTTNGGSGSQMAEFGVWQNKRFVSANFTNSAPVSLYNTGIEFTHWHDRFKITLVVQPTADILNGQLQLSLEIPTEYANYYNTGSLHGFALTNDKGFVVKGGENVNNIEVNNNIVTVLTSPQDLLIDNSYEVSLLFYVEKNDLSLNYNKTFNEESEVLITANQIAPEVVDMSSSFVTYNKNEGVHEIKMRGYGMGQYNCGLLDVIQIIDFKIENTEPEEKRVRLGFKQTGNIIGFNSLICNANGDPSGLPNQVSKNWHTVPNIRHGGNWIREYTELIIPGNTTLNFQYRQTGSKWGETYTASSHQLSLAGYVDYGKLAWLEAALGGFGETITHSPDYSLGKTNAADIRPFLVTNGNYGGNSSRCNWTGNVGGLDMWVYNSNGSKQIQKEVKTKFHRYSPNLTETTVGAVSADEKLKLDYTFYLNRSDDYTRVYYKINIEALENTDFKRFDILQLGGDVYNIHNTQSVVYGNESGVSGEFLPTNDGSNAYTTSEIALTGTNPWIWAGDGLY